MEFRSLSHRGPAIDTHYVSAGNPDNPLIVCLHGFPEYWAGWSGVMTALADRYFVVAPDQRGYNLSGKPEGVDAYRTRHLVSDLASLVDVLSPGRPFALAGHDWGASVAYAYAFGNPGRLSHLIVANGIHPACFQRAINEDADQRAASQYIHKLRADGAEGLLSQDGYRRLFNMLEGFSRTGWMTAQDRTDYLAAWDRPGALSAMLNWYRASMVDVPLPGEPAPRSKILEIPVDHLTVRVPHLVVWGEDDEALRPSCLEGLDRYVGDLTVSRVPGAGHWILHERPGEVAGVIAGFLGSR